jgi:glycosyltransferase involved in cell wall biosynthesis
VTVRYLAITPARDEERLLPGLIESMRAQTIAPARWIIIDDGSTDGTAAILDQAARVTPWIEPHHLKPDRPRQAGGESVIMQFLTRDTWRQMDFIFRLDADLSFANNLVELLIAEFERYPASESPVRFWPNRTMDNGGTCRSDRCIHGGRPRCIPGPALKSSESSKPAWAGT